MLSGTCLGIAYLVDTSALYFVIVLFVMLVIIGLRQELAGYAAKAAIQFLVTFLVFAIPNIAWMTYANDSLTILNRPSDTLQMELEGIEPGTVDYEESVYGLNAEGEVKLYELQEDDGFFATAVSRPWDLLKAMGRGAYDLYLRDAQSLFPIWLIPMFGLGLFSAVWTRREALKFGFFLVMLLPALAMPVIWSNNTFVLPFMVILMVVTGKGWAYLEQWSSDTMDELAGWRKADESHKRAVVRVFAVVILLPVAALSLWTVSRVDHNTGFRDAGEWISENGGDDDRIMSRESLSAWYAEGTQVLLPYGTLGEIVEYGRDRDAGYLIVSRYLVDELRPDLQPLLEAEEDPAGLEAVYTSGEGTDDEVVVYRLQE